MMCRDRSCINQRRGAEALCHLFKPGSTFHVYPSVTDIKAEPLFDIIVECIEEEFRPPYKHHVDRLGFCNFGLL